MTLYWQPQLSQVPTPRSVGRVCSAPFLSAIADKTAKPEHRGVRHGTPHQLTTWNVLRRRSQHTSSAWDAQRIAALLSTNSKPSRFAVATTWNLKLPMRRRSDPRVVKSPASQLCRQADLAVRFDLFRPRRQVWVQIPAVSADLLCFSFLRCSVPLSLRPQDSEQASRFALLEVQSVSRAGSGTAFDAAVMLS